VLGKRAQPVRPICRTAEAVPPCSSFVRPHVRPEVGSSGAMDRPDTLSMVRKQFAEAASGTGTRALLWAAALAVVWLNGLEPLAEQVWDLRRAFASLNQEKQEVERRNLAFYQANVRRAANQAALVAWERTLAPQKVRLANIEKQLAMPSLGGKEREDLSREKDSLSSSLDNFPKATIRLGPASRRPAVHGGGS
jgi:hypothetical protein